MPNGKKNALEGISKRLYDETQHAYQKRDEAGGTPLLPDTNKKGYLPAKYQFKAERADPAVQRGFEAALKGRGQNLNGRQPRSRGG